MVAKEERRRPRWRSWAITSAGLGACFLVAGLAGEWLGQREIRDYRAEGSTLSALDHKGRVIWERELDRTSIKFDPDHPFTLNLQPLLADVDGDSRNELVFPSVDSRTRVLDELLCLDATGTLLWSYRPDFEIRTKEGVYRAPWMIRVVRALPRPGGGNDVLMAIAHRTNSPAAVVHLDSAGRVQQVWWHAGHVLDLAVKNLDGDGRTEVYALAISNTYGSASALILDASRLNGATLEPDDEHRFLDVPEAPILARVLIPPLRTTLGERAYNSPGRFMFEDTAVLVEVREAFMTAGDPTRLCGYYHAFNHRLEHLQYRLADALLITYRIRGWGDPEPDVKRATSQIRWLVRWKS